MDHRPPARNHQESGGGGLNYVANRGVWWGASAFLAGTSGTTNTLAPLNVISQNTLRAYGFNDFTSATEAKLLTTTVNKLTPAQQSTLAARGITGAPYANFPTNQTVLQSLRAYPQYNNSGLVAAPLGNTWYDSFQLNVTQRFNHGLSFNFNYTYSKNLELTNSVDPFNRRSARPYRGTTYLTCFALPCNTRCRASATPARRWSRTASSPPSCLTGASARI